MGWQAHATRNPASTWNDFVRLERYLAAVNMSSIRKRSCCIEYVMYDDWIIWGRWRKLGGYQKLKIRRPNSSINKHITYAAFSMQDWAAQCRNNTKSTFRVCWQLELRKKRIYHVKGWEKCEGYYVLRIAEKETCRSEASFWSGQASKLP